MGRRNDHSREELRHMALEAASHIVAEQGLKGLTTRKVATAIGYAVGSLYLVFDNLEDLILQLNADTLDVMYDFVVNKAADPQAEPEARILALGYAYMAFAAREPERWRAVFDFQHSDDPILPDWYQVKIGRLFQLIEAPLQSLTPAAEPHAIAQSARALWGGVHGICLLAFSGKLDVVGADSVQDLLGLLIRNYLAGEVSRRAGG